MLLTNTSLKTHNTFGIDVHAAYFAQFDSIKSLTEILQQRKELPLFILGGGSNVLFTEDFKGIVLKNEIQDRQKLAISMMPEGILETISKEKFYALIKYLQTEEQTELP